MHDAAKKMNSPSQTSDNRSVTQTNEYLMSSAHALIPRRSLFEVLQAYDAKMIPTNIQKLEDELAQATATFIQVPHHSLHQQLLDLSLVLNQPLEFHAILDTIAMRFASAGAEQDFSERYQQFKDQLVHQHVRLCIASLQALYPKFKTALLDLETAMFEKHNGNIDDMFLKSSINAKRIAANSISLLHEVIHIIATRFSCKQEVNMNRYLKIKQQIVSALLAHSLNEKQSDDEHFRQMKNHIEICFKQENPLTYLEDNKKAIATQLHYIFQVSPANFYTLIHTFDKGFAYSNIALEEEVYPTAPYFKAYFAPRQAIQSIRDLKSKTYSSKINHAIDNVARYFETGLADPDPKTYFKKNQPLLERHLNGLQSTPGSLWHSLLNVITGLVCSCFSLFGTPTWLKTHLDTNKCETGDRYMFFTGGDMQRAKIRARKASIAITTVEGEQSQSTGYIGLSPQAEPGTTSY